LIVDIRLNPGLMKECGKDVMKFCDNAVRLSSPTETEGRVLYCLRSIFAQQNQFKSKVPIARVSSTNVLFARVSQVKVVIDRVS